jgi:uncharacterized integral membrane protein
MARFLIPLMTAFGCGAIALIALQNARGVSLQFLGFQSIEIPFGLMLALSVAVGMVGMAIAQGLWSVLGDTQSRRYRIQDEWVEERDPDGDF